MLFRYRSLRKIFFSTLGGGGTLSTVKHSECLLENFRISILTLSLPNFAHLRQDSIEKYLSQTRNLLLYSKCLYQWEIKAQQTFIKALRIENITMCLEYAQRHRSDCKFEAVFRISPYILPACIVRRCLSLKLL